ncbi:serine hydrolase [Chondromyces crocatus]|uniref:Serine hydrolase n=1 Tax=Chondromyces crocatus TaxID=52 RepID=A0A0K1EIX8_CHOCO|nr:serine hydrolase [Chondromyces crocatus]AKT40617.1 serine hydrolase [Chondromyces crocatus]
MMQLAPERALPGRSLSRRTVRAGAHVLALSALCALAACASTPPPEPLAPAQSSSDPGPPALVTGSTSDVQRAPNPSTPEEALTRFLTAERPEETWFSPDFLDKVPIGAIGSVLTQLRDELGAFVSVAPEGPSGHVARFARGTVPIRAKLDAEGRFTTLFLAPPEQDVVDFDGAIAALRSLPGKHHLLVVTDGKPRVESHGDEPLAVGSAFKLAILAALRGQVDTKKRAWKDVVTLKPEHRSLPSGTLHEWPAGSLLTVQSLASLMIAQSDNTATDALIDVVGRRAIEPFAPHARPFLSTREAFVLKAQTNEALLGRWVKADEAGRRTLLAEIDRQPLPPPEAFSSEPRAIADVEWFFSARELCGLMEKVHDLPLFSINPGLARAKDWESVAFKGGSEPGVLNLTTRVSGKGHTHCVVATFNDGKPIDERRVVMTYGQVLAALRTP